MAQRRKSAERKSRSPRAVPTWQRETAYAAEKPARAASAAAEAAEGIARRNADAVQREARAVGDRMQEAAQLWTELAQDAMRQNVDTAQSLMRCRTVTDVLEVQSDWVRRSLDNVMNRGARLSELSAQLAMETMGRLGSVAEANLDASRRVDQRFAR